MMKWIGAIVSCAGLWLTYEVVGQMIGWPDITIWQELALWFVGVLTVALVFVFNL